MPKDNDSMQPSLYGISIPVMIRFLGHLAAVLEKGRAFADAESIPHADLLDSRLSGDMMSLVGQVQRASDTAKLTAVRIGQVPNRPMPDDERTFDHLLTRIGMTVAFLGSVPPAAFDGRAEAEVPHPAAPGRHLTGLGHVLEFALPNFFFHVTTVYDLLRMKGVPLGKKDYLGWR